MFKAYMVKYFLPAVTDFSFAASLSLCVSFNMGLTIHLLLPVGHRVSMSPSLARSAPSELNHWWSQLRFRLQNKKGWNEMLDETFLLYTKQ